MAVAIIMEIWLAPLSASSGSIFMTVAINTISTSRGMTEINGWGVFGFIILIVYLRVQYYENRRIFATDGPIIL